MNNSLPKFNAPTYTEILPDSGKEITLRPYLIGEEKLFLEVINSKSTEIEKFKNIISRFIKGIEIDELSMIDMFFIIAKIRSMSKGEEVEIKTKCSECDKKYETSFDIIESLEIKNVNEKSKAVVLDDKLTIEIVPIKFIDSLTDSTSDYVCSIIKRVFYDGKIYSDFTREELKEQIVDNLSAQYVKKIVDEYKKLITLDIEVETICPYCKNKDKYEVENIFNFFI